MSNIKIKEPYRVILLVIISLLLVKNVVLGVLLTDVGAIPTIIMHLMLIYLIRKQHEYAMLAIYSWAGFYLLLLTGLKAGAKTLVILGGNGWEINTLRYQIDIGLFVLGIVVLLFGKKMTEGSSSASEQ